MWRFLGQLPVNLFALNRGWGTLYFDTDGLRLPPTVVVWHNRRKVTARVRILYEHAQAQHCSLPLHWRQQSASCCGRRRRTGPHHWPVWAAHVNESACARATTLNLRNLSTLDRLGVLERLAGVDLWRRETRSGSFV